MEISCFLEFLADASREDALPLEAETATNFRMRLLLTAVPAVVDPWILIERNSPGSSTSSKLTAVDWFVLSREVLYEAIISESALV